MIERLLAPLTARFGRYASAVLALVLLQTLILGWMVAQRVAILRSGTVVTLQSEPVDPRDIFRGDYVTLAYGITTIDLTTVNGDLKWKDGETIYVELTPSKDTWRAMAVFHTYPAPALGNKIIRGHIDYLDETRNVARISYGVERYYVPEGEGRALENERNARALSVDVALAGNGEAAIKGIRIDGKPVYEEPVF